MSRSYHQRPKPVIGPWNGEADYYRWGVKQYRANCSSSHRRPRKPHRSCGLCHLEKVYRLPHHRDQRLTQDRIAEEIDRYWDERR